MNSKKPTICLSFASPLHSLLYVLIICLTSITIIASYGGGNKTDHQALLNIKSMITRDPFGALTSWNNSLHFCDWTGVKCGKRHGRVTYLGIKSRGLEGSLSPHIGNLSFLRVLSLANNSFQGVIPNELDRLSRLRILSLYENKFNGVIPANISSCSNLKVFDLSRNEIGGSIPKDIGFLTNLTILSLGDNNLRGGIPPILGNSTSIEVFSVTRNLLGGNIPYTLGRWKFLKEIYLGECDLSGIIPHSLYNLSLLTNISFPGNQLTGSLHPAFGALLPHLVGVQLWGNQLTGPLPPFISNCSRLIYLEMDHNKFSGKLTVDFTNLRDIRYIQLGSNNFGSKEADEMKFIDSLKNCTRLQKLYLGRCKFEGVLPESIGNLSKQLRTLYLIENQLHGRLPRSIGNLDGLELLALGGNQFTGNIPSTISNLQKLQVVDLFDNKLSGPIPNVIGNLSLLISLYLNNNMLEGAIPSSLGNCQRLIELYLNDNKLNGKIPSQLLQLSSMSIELDLSQNNLFGSLPTNVGDLKMLGILDLSHNNISGNIPSSLSGCASLSRLSFRGNKFEGLIPPSLISLKGLVELDISDNNLSGQIPQFLEQLIVLEYLDLSHNDFEGEVPTLGVFANASAFFILGDDRLCGGLVELGLPKCNETKKHSKKLHAFVIVILIASTLFTIICLAYAWFKKKSKSKTSQLPTRDRFLKVSYGQLLKATNGFSEANLIGNGGFSSVYKGILDEDDNRFVAVKVLHLQNRGAQSSFTRECTTWRSIRHRNLLRIITSCSSIDFQGNSFKALIYEFMPRGSLHDLLHSNEGTYGLNLLQRINILMDVACAIDYIHNHCVPTLVHGDLKPSNILLDDDMIAHVGDFGLARFLGTTSYQNSSTGIRGTIGYAPPEYGLGNEMTSSGDIYSFGILLLEVLTGKKPTDDIFNECLNLHKYASMALQDHVMNVVDFNILNAYQEMSSFNNEANAKKLEECLSSAIKIGVSCSMDSPTQRIDIVNVLHELRHILDILQHIEERKPKPKVNIVFSTLIRLYLSEIQTFCVSNLFQTRTVQVGQLSDLATEREIHEFFSFSGDIEHVEICRDSKRKKTAYVTFKDPRALEIALLLSGATIVDQIVSIIPAENYEPKPELREVREVDDAVSMSPESSSPVEANNTSPRNARVYMSKAQDVVSSVLAKGTLIRQDAVNKAKAFDEKHQLRANASDKRVRLSEKFNVGVSAVNEKVKSVDQKLQVSDKTMAALMAAERKLNNTGSAVKSSRYVTAGTAWLNGAFGKVAKAGQVAGTKTREKWNMAVTNLTAKDSPIAA
ncbi:hypothetical protein SSX86_002636 [Deinandra increscens subsp. villosa]|uniref:non-specific serine/threonine protein kinase n=1 Tax=Deinandra increscens subsp. villosa TaxID=3103831 RepID=A0AAP0DWT8_9ASTR